MPKSYKRFHREIALALCALPLSTTIAPIFTIAAPSAPATQPAEISRDQIEALIQQAGANPPAWWDATPLNVPDGMDLSWGRQTAGAAVNNNNIRTYMLVSIFPNPDRWQEGTKLVQHSLTIAKDDPNAKGNAELFLCMMYTEMLEDYARGAFWARKVGPAMSIRLAQCYLKLGSKPMAVELLSKVNPESNRDPGLIKAWAEVGDLDKALAAAEDLAKTVPAAGYFNAAEACRMAGKIPDAIAYYQKTLTADKAGTFSRRATASLQAIKLYDSLDLKKVPDGNYSDEALGYTGPVRILLVVKDHRIVSVKVTDHHEKRFFSSIIDTSAQIVLKQSVKGIDTTSGATITSEAIINASAKALSTAQK